MIQIDGTKRQFHIKVTTQEIIDNITTRAKGTLTYVHTEGILSTVKIGIAGLGGRRIRPANLPTEMPRMTIIRALETYGKVGDIKDEMWSQTYQYKVSNGILIVTTKLTKHIPSHLTIGGYRSLVSYDGQPTTCYACNESGQLIQNCQRRQRTQGLEFRHRHETWATIIAREEGNMMDTSDTMIPPQRTVPTQEKVVDFGGERKEASSGAVTATRTEAVNLEQHRNWTTEDKRHGLPSQRVTGTELKDGGAQGTDASGTVGKLPGSKQGPETRPGGPPKTSQETGEQQTTVSSTEEQPAGPQMEIGRTAEQAAKREELPPLVASDGYECQPSQVLRNRKKKRTDRSCKQNRSRSCSTARWRSPVDTCREHISQPIWS
jgi:hypothetical protein